MCSSITTNVLTFQICVSKGPVEQWGSLAVSWEILCFNLVESVSHSVLWLFATPWTVAHQAPPSMGFSRQEYWRGFPFLSPGDLPNPGIKPGCHALQADSIIWANREVLKNVQRICISSHWVSVYSFISKGLRLDDCWCAFQPPKYDRYWSFEGWLLLVIWAWMEMLPSQEWLLNSASSFHLTTRSHHL